MRDQARIARGGALARTAMWRPAPAAGRPVIRKATRNAVAAVCLLIGIAGLFLPFIQGIAMIVLAVVIADFDAKERLLERYRHTRVGRHLWERHEARKANDLARRCRAAEIKSGPFPLTAALEANPVEDHDGECRRPPGIL